MFQSPFPLEVAFECVKVELADKRLAQPAHSTAPSSGKRAREYQAGRKAAKLALTKLGQAFATDLTSAPDGAPLWPNGICGSISHSKGLAVAAATYQQNYLSLGLDLQELRALRMPLAFAERICTKNELANLSHLGKLLDEQLLRIFSVKEALYKALSKYSAKRLLFKDAEVCFNGAAVHAEVLGFNDPISVRQIRSQGFILSGVLLKQLANSAQCDN